MPGQAARVMREVAWALAYAHGSGIVHRDVSADNILLERGTERAIVMDFGIASALHTAAVADDGRIMGNALYVSPEQAAGEPVNERSDLYSLGVVGYYALTGRHPFVGETSTEIVTQHLTATPPAITSVAPTVPPRLAAAVERCLHKEPLRRYRTAESLAEAIDLAFEHAKDIPAPLRSWISQNERELPVRFAMVGMGTAVGFTLSAVFRMPWLMAPSILGFASLCIGPWSSRLRRILGDGYTTDDLHAALREHQLARAEELEYERRQISPLATRLLRIVAAGSVGAAALGGWLFFKGLDLERELLVKTGSGHALPWSLWSSVNDAQQQGLVILFPALAALTVVGVPLVGQWYRYRFASRVTAATISFWKGRVGRQIARFVTLGATPAERPALGMPVLTEIALGRATDHLYEALPREARRQLANLPPLVRRLEEDASALRQTMAALDDQISAFERAPEAIDAPARALRAEVEEAREAAAGRLTATVAAIESVRLDLLRLQMGTATVQSVTASLEAAERIGREIERAVGAHAEIEALLLSSGDVEDDDADTPVSGVPAARG